MPQTFLGSFMEKFDLIDDVRGVYNCPYCSGTFSPNQQPRDEIEEIDEWEYCPHCGKSALWE